LGGRLDSTNIISPVLSVITNIGHDHMDLLGNSLSEIAAEKAGIIKDKTPVVIGETSEETRKVFDDMAAKKHSQILFSDTNFECHIQQFNALTAERKYSVRDITEDNTIAGSIPLGGDYQERNLTTLFQAFSVLKPEFNLSTENLIEGIRKVITNTGLKGRWQVLRRKPLVICDTGHNKEGLEFVTRQLLNMKVSKLHMVMGFVSDKDLSLVFPLLPKNALYYFTKASIPRALNEKALKSMASESGLHGNSFSTVREALDAAIAEAAPEDLIFVGGSTFVVAEVV
jgi:dihydrofolate synthase/folylpolyglutamate synthase